MRQLKILIITHGPWSSRFGAVKVHIEIKEEYERQGHVVDKISIEDLYPKGENAITKVFGKLYTEHIHKFLKKNAYKYDVIDANFSCVVYPKETFGFKGVLLTRSHGIDPVYKWAEENIERYKQALVVNPKKIRFKTRIGNIYRKLQKKAGDKEFKLSVNYADLVHCLNKAEYQYFLSKGVSEVKLLLLPNGISDDFIYAMNLCPIINKLNSLCFVGSWSIRKGIKDMDEIVSNVQLHTHIEKVVLLGGQTPKTMTESYFSDKNKPKLLIKPDFDKSELSVYTEQCKVGIFPSYVEGFGLAIVEQLSIGIPVIAYNVPGPSEILNWLDESFLITPGDILSFSRKINEVLQMSPDAYDELSKKCKQVSRKFLLSNITKEFLKSYNAWLSNN